jgi:hypothetical protein
MALPDYYVATEEDMCKCGRKASIHHCPRCGSFKLKAYAKLESIYDEHGNLTEVQAYRCDACNFRFNERMFLACQAPIYETREMTKQRKQIELAAGFPLNQSERGEFLRIMLKNSGRFPNRPELDKPREPKVPSIADEIDKPVK